MDEVTDPQDDFAASFEAAFGRLQVRVETACAAPGPWTERVVEGVRQGLRFAASEPVAANVLTNEAQAHGGDGLARYDRLLDYVAGLLEPGREEGEHGPLLPEVTERAIAGGVATIVANRVDRGREGELPGLAPEVIQFVLTPYLGAEEARRIAAEAG
jgi:AcrR family transcriptional regulator